MAKRKKGAIVGTMDSDSDNEIEIDLSATMNIQERSAHISHKRFISESVQHKPTMPVAVTPLVSSTSPTQPLSIAQPQGQVVIKQPKRKQVCIPHLISSLKIYKLLDREHPS